MFLLQAPQVVSAICAALGWFCCFNSVLAAARPLVFSIARKINVTLEVCPPLSSFRFLRTLPGGDDEAWLPYAVRWRRKPALAFTCCWMVFQLLLAEHLLTLCGIWNKHAYSATRFTFCCRLYSRKRLCDPCTVLYLEICRNWGCVHAPYIVYINDVLPQECGLSLMVNWPRTYFACWDFFDRQDFTLTFNKSMCSFAVW